jgi:hypothetical protein
MPTWTDLSDLPLGETISTTLWNTIFGPNGNQAYLKKYADNVTYELETIYTADIDRLYPGWPQGLTVDSFGNPALYDTGDVYFPEWFVIGTPSDKYISLTGPAKYLAVLTIQFYPNQGGPLANVDYSTFRVLAIDTTGNLNTQKTIISPQAVITTGDVYESYSMPFIIDAPFNTNVMIGFVLQQRFETSTQRSNVQDFNIGANTNIVFHKLPMYFDDIVLTSAVTLGTSVLNGTSAF